MQVPQLFAVAPEIANHPAVLLAGRLADELLAPHAVISDDPARGVDPAHLRALADAGLFSVKVPVAEGGLGGDERVDAEVIELLAGADAATWFVLTQHRLPQKLTRTPYAGIPEGVATAGPAGPRDREHLARASMVAGIAIAHIRRPGTPAVDAEPDGVGGYRLSGRADWCTGWGLIDLVLIAGRTPDERFVFGLRPAREQPGLTASGPLPLAVMGGTRTVALTLDGLVLAPEDVLLTVDVPAWQRVDTARTANATPASLGLLRRMLTELERLGVERGRPEAVELALALAGPAAKLRGEAYALLCEVPPTERIAQRTALRAELDELSVRAAAGLVAARAGSAMLTTSPEQRWAREAAFFLIQAQTVDVRAAQLRALRG